MEVKHKLLTYIIAALLIGLGTGLIIGIYFLNSK